jgi:hypothetical protein
MDMFETAKSRYDTGNMSMEKLVTKSGRKSLIDRMARDGERAEMRCCKLMQRGGGFCDMILTIVCDWSLLLSVQVPSAVTDAGGKEIPNERLELYGYVAGSTHQSQSGRFWVMWPEYCSVIVCAPSGDADAMQSSARKTGPGCESSGLAP